MANLHKVKNNCIGLIQNSPLASGGTNLIVNNALDSKLSGMGFKFWLTLWTSGLTPDTDPNMEIVEVTARPSPNNYTIVRAQQGTTAHQWSQFDNVALLWTAGNAHEILDDVTSVAKGTIIVYGADLLPHLLPVGANGKNLQADSAQTLGLAYVAPEGVSFANGFSTIPAGSSPSVTQTITHGLGIIPKKISLKILSGQASGGPWSDGTLLGAAASSQYVISDGEYDASGQNCSYVTSLSGNQVFKAVNGIAGNLEQGGGSPFGASGVIGNITTTTFDIVWTRYSGSGAATPGGVAFWKAQG